MDSEPRRPSILYKYRPLNDWTKELLTTRMLYFPSIDEINDPFDCRVLLNRNASHRYLWNWTKKKLSTLYGTNDEVQLVLRWLKDQNHFGPSFSEADAKEYLRKKKWKQLDPNNPTGHNLIMDARKANIRMYCLSAVNNDILMWSHYAQNHHGICLGFDMDSNPVFAKTAEVKYVNRYPRANYYRVSNQQYYEYSLFTKSSLWKHEKEWRLLLTEGVEGKKAAHHFKPEFLKILVFGCQTSDSERIMVRQWLSEGGLGPTFYIALPSDTEYKLILDGVSDE